MSAHTSNMEAEIGAAVRDYLEYIDLNKTAESFDNELQALGRPLPQTEGAQSLKEEVKRKMLTALESGQHKAFFDLWNEVIPQHVRQSEGQKIEFYINIFFAIFPIHPLIKASKPHPLSETMPVFQKFLATKGSDLSKTSAFLAFYALPYVPDPGSHPTFQDLFTEEWLAELRSRVERFLTSSIKPTKPTIYNAFEKLHSSRGNSRSADDSNYITQLEQANESYLRQNERMQLEKVELINIATELAQALQKVLDGQHLTSDYIQHIFANVSRFYPNQHASGYIPQQKQQQHILPGSAQGRPLAALDYNAVQKELLAAGRPQSADLAGRLLQALRWRLSRTELGDARSRVLQAYLAHDLLGCSTMAQQRILSTLFAHNTSPSVREYAARLVNCISCECAGRAYLLQSSNLLSLLWDILTSESGDTILRQQALGAMQKLSLRRSAQTQMIGMGVVNWIIDILSDIDSIGKYTLEYASALLLNLSLRSTGRRACEKTKVDVLKVLNDLLECDNLQVRFYTNGTLYSVLSRPALRERARAMGMEDILKYLIQSSDENFAKQIDYILKQLSRVDDEDENPESDEEGDGEDDDDDELVGDEEEAPEGLADDGQPAGEALLCSKYLAKTADARREDEVVRKSMDVISHKKPDSHNNNTNAQQRTAKSNNPAQQRPVTPGYATLPVGGGNQIGTNVHASATMQPPADRVKKAAAVDRRPRTPGGFSNQELEELQAGFGQRAKMARTPQTIPTDLEPLPVRKVEPPRSAKKK